MVSKNEESPTIEVVENAADYGIPLLHVRFQGEIWKVLHASSHRRGKNKNQGVPWVVLTKGSSMSRALAKPDEIEPVFD